MDGKQFGFQQTMKLKTILKNNQLTQKILGGLTEELLMGKQGIGLQEFNKIVSLYKDKQVEVPKIQV